MTCAQMYRFKDSDAIEIVPEVAEGQPIVEKGGTKVTINLKSGFKFSDGTKVTSRSFKRAIERGLDPVMGSANFGSPVPGFFGDVIKMDAKKDNQLVLTLSKPIPDLVPRLTMPFTCAVPENTAVSDLGLDAIPMAGPYYFAQADEVQIDIGVPFKFFYNLQLKKNPYYTGTRKQGIDTLKVDIGNYTDRAVNYKRLINNCVDFTTIDVSDVLKIKAQRPDQYIVRPEASVRYLALNQSSPSGLFSHVEARKALNMVLDREAIVSVSPNPDEAKAASHMLPALVPGFIDAEPYPVTSAATAAALPAAHDLMASIIGSVPEASKHLRIVDRLTSQVSLDRVNLLKSNIENAFGDLGITVEIVQLGSSIFNYIENPANLSTWEIAPVGWVADYLDGFDFINILFTQNLKNNYGRYYDPVQQAAMNACAAIGTEPARSTCFGQLDQNMTTQSAPAAYYAFVNSVHTTSSRSLGCGWHQGATIQLNEFCTREVKSGAGSGDGH